MNCFIILPDALNIALVGILNHKYFQCLCKDFPVPVSFYCTILQIRILLYICENFLELL